MTDLLQIEVLGGFSLKINGEPLKQSLSRKGEALLVYLACNRQLQARNRLAELLWDERGEELSLSNLRTLITRVRPQLAPYLVINRDTVGINLQETYSFDLQELEREISQVRQAAFSPASAERLENALKLYKGDFLQDFYLRDATNFEEWVSQERERVRKLVIDALGQLVNYHESLAEYDAAARLADRLLQLDPLREEVHRQQMLLLARSGQRRAALNHYKAYQRYLTHELDVAPEAATTDLYERIRKNEIGGDFTAGFTESSRIVSNLTGLSLPTLNRVEQLRRVSLFAGTPDDILIELAGLLEEVAVKAGETIFEKGEIGNCMYIIVDGQVRVHDGNTSLNNLSSRDIVGEMAVLDAAPRLASVTALTDARLWRLEQETLYRLMAGRLEVVRGIIQVLSRRLRDRVQDVFDLQARLETLTDSDEQN